MGIYVYFFFLMCTFSFACPKEKVHIRKDPVCTAGATPAVSRPKGQKLASLRQSALFNGRQPSYASRSRDDAGEPCGV